MRLPSGSHEQATGDVLLQTRPALRQRVQMQTIPLPRSVNQGNCGSPAMRTSQSPKDVSMGVAGCAGVTR